MIVRQPLALIDQLTGFDIKVNVTGGGESGQAGAVRHGITRYAPDRVLRTLGLRFQGGFVTRDAREVERKESWFPQGSSPQQFSKR